MLTPQQKIDAIYEILLEQKNARRRGILFYWFRKIFFFSILVVLFLYPKEIFGFIWDFVAPYIQNMITEALNENKNEIMDVIKNQNENFSQLIESQKGNLRNVVDSVRESEMLQRTREALQNKFQ